MVTSRTNSSSLLPDSGVLGEQLSLQLEARGFSEVGVDQREVSVEVVVPDPKDGAIVGQFGVDGGGLQRLSREPLAAQKMSRIRYRR